MENLLKNFGSEKHPIRISSLPLLVKCPWQAAMKFLGELDDSGSIAADTGSAVHKAVAEWHAGRDGIAAMKQYQETEFPLADLDEAEKQFQAYCGDPRNQTAEIVACEQPVEVDYETVYFKGTCDQIRRQGGDLQVWDIKTSKKDGLTVLFEHTYQLVGYSVAASAFLSQPVSVGGIILTRGYRRRGVKLPDPGGVFFHSTITAKQAEGMIKHVTRIAKRIRNGDLYPGPGDHCRNCPLMGVGSCIPLLEEFENGGSVRSKAA